ncbi:MAG: ribosome biogenesis GTPase YlqF [Thomasclavelia sp.]|nr:ribosome biogenesis GTPase YlqF [Thomasclavelia sp.]
MAQIQWFPGHMAKARREIEEKVKIVDIVIEVVDARAPISSKNPILNEIIKNKPTLIVMSKIDLADKNITNKWVEYYKSINQPVIALNLKDFNSTELIIKECSSILKEKMDKELSRGLKPRAIRAMIVGIPNVGKSTFINRLAKKKVTITGNKPGVTKAQQIIKVSKDFELFDTPGVLWPKIDDEKAAINIALIGSIKQQILPLDDLMIYAVKYLVKNYPNVVENRYKISINLDDDWIEKCFDDIAANNKLKQVRGSTDYDRVIEIFFNDLYSGKLGQISWEQPNA